jgi:hypothetical protein
MNPRKNGTGGPKTFAGKVRASQNSRTHGLFAQELHLSEAERLQYDQFKDEFAKELQPTTALLRLVFEDVIACAWRMKLSLRCEQVQVRECLGTNDEENRTKPLASTTPVGPPVTLELRRRLKLIEELESRFRAFPNVSEYPEMEKQITDVFGVQFWRTLTEWEPANPVALQLAMMAVERSDIYGTELPTEAHDPEAERKHMKADEFARMQMMTKIVELERQHLLSVIQHFRDAQGRALEDPVQRLDLFLRYQTKSRRDFYHTLREYWSLKEAEEQR